MMMIKRLGLGVLAGIAVATLATAVPTGASAHTPHAGVHVSSHYSGGYYRSGYWHAGYWAPGYWMQGDWGRSEWAPRYWVHGVVLQNGCPTGYVRDGGLCFPTF